MRNGMGTGDLAAGASRACAAIRAGTSERTLYRWLAQGRRGRKPFVAFMSALKKAEADSEAVAVVAIRDAADKHWQAAAWWLERKFPESWARDAALIRQLLRRIRKLESECSNKKVNKG